MATWEGIRRAAAERFRLAHDEPGWFGVFTRDRYMDKQLVRIELTDRDNEAWLLVMSPVCFENDLPHRTALVHNLRLTAGTLALDGDRYELMFAVAVAAIDESVLCDRAFALATEADQLRRQYQATTHAARTMSPFED